MLLLLERLHSDFKKIRGPLSCYKPCTRYVKHLNINNGFVRCSSEAVSICRFKVVKFKSKGQN